MAASAVSVLASKHCSMATVLSWPPQSAGADIACAGWPGSNGSVIGTNVTAVDGAVAVAAVPAGLAVAGALCVGALPVVLAAVAVALRVAPPAAGPPEPPHPASTPTATADMAPSAIPPPTVLLPPKVTGRRPPRD
jgi:hypothetical protein